MPVVWPVTITARPSAEGFRESTPQLTLRSEMDAGPAKVRRRFTAGPRFLDVSYLFSAAELEDFEEFYLDDTAGGSLDFEYVHPRTGDTVQARFLGPPEYELAGADAWRASFRLEVLP